MFSGILSKRMTVWKNKNHEVEENVPSYNCGMVNREKWGKTETVDTEIDFHVGGQHQLKRDHKWVQPEQKKKKK